jgi:hypothetical protein
VSDGGSSSTDTVPSTSLALEDLKPTYTDKNCSKSTVLDYIKIPELCYPASQFDGWEPPCPVLPEKEVLDKFLVF